MARQAESKPDCVDIDFRALIEVAPEGVHIHQDGKIVYSNQTNAEQYGASSSSEVIGLDILSFVFPADRSLIKGRIKRLLDEGGVLKPVAHRRIRLDGRTAFVEGIAMRIDFCGQPAVLSMVRDLTEQQCSKLALEQSEERFQRVVEALPAGLVIIHDGIISYANSALTQQLGADKPDSLIGKNFYSFFGSADQKEMRGRRRKMFATGKPAPLTHRRMRRLDAAEVDIEATAVAIHWDEKPAIVGLCHDITERITATKAQRQTEDDLVRLIAALPAAVIIRQEEYIVYANVTAAKQLGADDAAGLIGRNFFDFFSADERLVIKERQRQMLATGLSAPLSDRCLRRLDGQWIDIESTALQVTWKGKPAVIGVFLDISSRLAAEARNRFLATHDPLTALPNRTGFQDQLALALASAKQEGRHIAVHYLDLDNFKDVNDSRGHCVGDQLLQALAGRLKEQLRASDFIARLGGDEFAVIQTEAKTSSDMAALARTLIRCTSEPYHLASGSLHVSVTIGIAAYPDDGDDVDELLRKADLALYRGKAERRHAFAFYTEDLNIQIQDREQMRADVERGITENEFEVHYQPIMRLIDGKISAVEALLRWRHPTKGLLAAEKFIDTLEASPNFAAIGEWVLRQACIQGRAWHNASAPALRIAVNLSMHQLRRSDLTNLVTKTLDETRLDKQYLELELTENAVLAIGVTEAAEILAQLNAMGIGIALDDFGTGYSSLTFLKRFPISKIKIDRSFIVGLCDSADDQAIVSGVIELGKRLNLQITAEGIDNAPTCDWLKSTGCDEAQGYYLARPMPAESLTRLLDLDQSPDGTATR